MRVNTNPRAAREAYLGSAMRSAQNEHGERAIECAHWREVLLERIDVARAGRDSEGVHGLRVACAHLDVFLRLLGWRVLRADLRWLRRAASAVRDLDVLLAQNDLPNEFAVALDAQRTPAREQLLAVLDHERCSALLDALEELPSLTFARAQRRSRKLATRVTLLGARAFRPDGDVDTLHALRRALRRLRYAHEWLGREPKAARRLQDELGALNDVVVAQRQLAALGLAETLSEYQAALAARLALNVQRVRGAWQETSGAILGGDA